MTNFIDKRQLVAAVITMQTAPAGSENVCVQNIYKIPAVYTSLRSQKPPHYEYYIDSM